MTRARANTPFKLPEYLKITYYYIICKAEPFRSVSCGAGGGAVSFGTRERRERSAKAGVQHISQTTVPALH